MEEKKNQMKAMKQQELNMKLIWYGNETKLKIIHNGTGITRNSNRIKNQKKDDLIVHFFE